MPTLSNFHFNVSNNYQYGTTYHQDIYGKKARGGATVVRFILIGRDAFKMFDPRTPPVQGELVQPPARLQQHQGHFTIRMMMLELVTRPCRRCGPGGSPRP